MELYICYRSVWEILICYSLFTDLQKICGQISKTAVTDQYTRPEDTERKGLPAAPFTSANALVNSLACFFWDFGDTRNFFRERNNKLSIFVT